MRKLILLVVVLVIGASFYSCRDKHTIIPPPTPTSAIRDSINLRYTNAVKAYTVNGALGGDILTDKGIKIHVPSFALRDLNGDTVLTNVNVTITEILETADMILMNKTTTSNGLPLVTGGQFKMAFSLNNNVVNISNDTLVYIKVPTNVSSPSMGVFYGAEDATGFVNWSVATNTLGLPASAPVVTDTNNGVTQNYYSFFLDYNSPNWINCDYFYNTGTPATALSINLPERFENSNTYFFIHFNTIRSIMSGYHDGNNFVTQGTIPVGSNVTLVLFSEIDGNFYSNFTENVIISNGYSTSTDLSPTTYGDLINTINAL